MAPVYLEEPESSELKRDAEKTIPLLMLLYPYYKILDMKMMNYIK